MNAYVVVGYVVVFASLAAYTAFVLRSARRARGAAADRDISVPR